MNDFNFIMENAIYTLPIAYMFGWLIGFILWLIRYLMLELPHTGRIGGGELSKWKM